MQSTDTELLLSRRSCGQEVPLRRLSYNKETRRLLCGACISGMPAKVADMRKAPLEKTGPRLRSEEDLVRYVCGECNFRFSRARHFAFVQCPYCASSKLVVDAVTEQILERKRLLNDLYG